jgi:two-component system NtrC family sensor kinase
MIKKYPWHFVYLIFVIICLANIFQKLKWSSPTDNITWKKTAVGLECFNSPKHSPIKKGDILLTVNKFIVSSKIDLGRIIEKRKYCRYEIERKGLLKNIGIDIVNKYTPFSYYILVFSGILSILLSLNILNANLIQTLDFQSPKIFFLLNLTFSGFLIFSPTGSYNLTDFIFLFLDRIAFIFFPALLLHFSILFPIRSGLLKKTRPKFLKFIIYIPPLTIFVFFVYFIMSNLFSPIPDLITLTLNHFRHYLKDYLSIYLIMSMIMFLVSNLIMIFVKRQKRFIFPLAVLSASILVMLVSNSFIPVSKIESSFFLSFCLALVCFLPLSLAYYLSRRAVTDIKNIIKRTISIASIFLFIFGIFFFLGINIEKNKLLGIFWSITAIVTAGLLFKPIEGTVQNYFEHIFFRSTFNFKKKLKSLIHSLPAERNLSLLSENFLDTINHGFNLKDSSLLIYFRKNIFYSLPQHNKILLSRNFRQALMSNENLVFYSDREFQKKFPKDSEVFRSNQVNQFLPLKTKDKLTGVIAFSQKMDKTLLSIEDWELLFSISSTLTLSVENAFLYSELENQLTELNLLKEFNENIIENLNLGIVVLSKLNIIRTWNVFMELKYNIPREKAINKKAYSVLGTDLWKLITTRKKGQSTFSNLKINIQNEEIIFDVYISPLKDNLGQTIGTILVFEDVTNRIRMQQQLITTEKMASLGFLSAGIAHEINTPLTGISSYCQFILDNPKNRENPDLVLKIQEQVQRANKIIGTLLDFSRQKGEQPVEVDINQVINESISLLDHKLKKKNIRLEKNFDLKNKIHGFSNRLQQLFINLLINAIDAIHDYDGKISIIGNEPNKEYIQIEIIDNGEGIDSKHIRKIFDPFFTTKEPGEGTGLGLSIAYNIVKDHYGDIKVESRMEKGSKFTITLPLTSPLRRIKI